MRFPRLAALASCCALLSVAVAGETAGATAGPAPSSALASTSTFGVASYNIAFALSASRATADIAKLTQAGAHVLGLQEMSRSRETALRASSVACPDCRYDGYFPRDLPGQSATPLLWNKARFTALSTGSLQMSEATFVGSRGAGPSTLAAKWVNYVHLRNIATGRAIYVLNSHAVPSVQGAGGPNYGNLERLRLYRQHMRGLKSLVTTLGATGEPVFVTGDYNVNYRSDSRLQSRMFPYASMHEVGASSNWELLGEPTRGTHVLPGGNATRLIDYVFSVRNRRATPMAQRILSGYSSDHRPVLVEFMLR